ncbi:SDR family NAD(P)-dependent oxidoreductase [Aerococcus sanguinicola]|uniref:SDR family NAD(P)-dependent oxidoreductase n=1 Tax=Aerococcus sanguinicola TaxID=119206 RepID=UPI001E36D3BD|nr:SDR family oxidoreductase [Aerococcus sanguinicola]
MTQKVAIITGGTSGIGLATAQKLSQEGYRLVLASVDKEEQVEAALESLGHTDSILHVACDVSDPSQCQAAVDKALDAFGRLDVLVNVAGITGERGDFLDYDLSLINQIIQINLMGTISFCQAAGQKMKEAGQGCIINVGSICSFLANGENIGYHASKGGEKMATQAIARELGPHGVRVLMVSPGWVNTSMMRGDLKDFGDSLHMKERVIEPEEVANAIYLLTLPEASAINGTNVMVEDGYTSFKGIF